MHFTRFYALFVLFFLTPCFAMMNEKSQFIDADIRDLDIDCLNMCLKTIDKHEKITFLQGFSLLHLAAVLGATDQAYELVRSKKYDVNDCDNEKGSTPLVIACLEDDAVMVRRLLKCGANPNITSKKGIVPLIEAIRNENFVLISILLAYGAEVNQKDIVHDNTSLHEAIGNGNSEIVRLLLHCHASPNLSLQHCFTPLMAAAQMEITDEDKETHCLRIVKALLDAKANPNIAHLEDGDTALHLAVSYGNREVVCFLLKAGADANALNEKNDTPLHIVLYTIKSSFKGNCKTTKRNCDIARLLLLHGAQLSKKQLTNKNIDFDLILGAAITTGANELVKFALEAGANANYKNAFGDTPLLIIARGGANKSQSAVIVSLLLEHGADYELLGADQRNALHIFMRNPCMSARKKNDTTLNMIDSLFKCKKAQPNKHNRK